MVVLQCWLHDALLICQLQRYGRNTVINVNNEVAGSRAIVTGPAYKAILVIFEIYAG